MINTPLQCMTATVTVPGASEQLSYVSRDGQHGTAHRLFDKDGCR